MPSQQTRFVPPTLDMLRREIDGIDDALLDLVERRVYISSSIAASKQAEGDALIKMRPRREAEVIERLTRRVRTVGPEMIGHIWRTLMSCGRQMQAPLHLVLAGDGLTMEDRLAMQDRIRIRFGPAARLRWAADEREAMDAARTTEAVALVASRRAPEPGGDVRMFETFLSDDKTIYALGRIAAEDAVPSEPVR